MSGFVGIVNLDGAPVDRDLLARLTQSIAYRGPDAQQIWIDDVQGNVGFGHTMLRTTFEAEREHQPCTLDGETWIAADCRIDARDELIPELAGRGCHVTKDATDPELILHAYAVWGADCVQHIIGDFSFAIWDGRERRLFCARDHMGVKLFYYAQVGNCLVFGNTLNSLRCHPSVSDRLNDLAIADYLMFGVNHDPVATCFADVSRLLGAHRVAWNGASFQIDRYWTVPIDPPLRLRRRSDYVEQFLALLRTVVRDRLRTNHVGILLSGGLDSPGLAAIAQELGRGSDLKLTAHTNVFDRLIPDRERHYTGIVASHLKIPTQFYVRDEDRLYEDCGDDVLARVPDPRYVTNFGPASAGSAFHGLACNARVALFGEGPDNALSYEWKPYVKFEWERCNYAALFRDAASFPILFRQMPVWGRIFRSRRHPRPVGGGDIPPWLSWVNPEFANRLNLRERYASADAAGYLPTRTHPVRPFGHASLDPVQWESLFEGFDSGITGQPVEVRLPYTDIRMLRYMLAVPAIPWCRDKYLMRHALKPYLPAEIVNRPKTGLAGFPDFERWKESGFPDRMPKNLLGDYVDLTRLSETRIDSRHALGDVLRAFNMAFFLRARNRKCDNTQSVITPVGGHRD